MRPRGRPRYVLVLAGTPRDARDWATWHCEELRIKSREQVIPVTWRTREQVRGRRGQTLYVLGDCYRHDAHGEDLLAMAKEVGMVIEWRSCDDRGE